MVNADQQWHIQRQTKQREAWIRLLWMLHDPGKNFFVTINHSLLDWKRLCAQIDHVPAQKLAKRVVAEKGLNHEESVAPHPPFLLLRRRSSTPPENHLSSVNSTFVVVFVFDLFHPQISSLSIFENFVGVGYPSVGLRGFGRLEPKLGETAFVCGLSNFE